MKVLIAEDENITRAMLERELSNYGYDVLSVVDGNEAWEELQREDAPKLVILDWMMPGMDGLELCGRLRQRKTIVPTYVVLLTSRDDENDIVRGLDAGADDYITKPFKNSELRARINVGRRMIELQATLLENEKLQSIIEIAGAVCHKMNQPLQVILGLSELLLLDFKKSDPLYKKIKTLKEQTESMGEITQKLMHITRYETEAYLKSKIVDIDKSSK